MATTDAERIRLLEERLATLELSGKVQVSEGTQKDSAPKDNEENKTDKAKTKPSSRARVVINRWDKKTDTRRDYDPTELTDQDGRSNSSDECAFLLRKVIGLDLKVECELELVGTELQSLLRDLLRHHPYHMIPGDTMASPFEPLVQNWDLLETAAGEESRKEGDRTAEQDKTARSDLKLLLDTIKEGTDPKLDEYFKIRESLKTSKSITYEALWTIFPPGTLVFSAPFLRLDQIFIVQNNRRTWPSSPSTRSSNRPNSQPLSWSLNCWTYDWNGVDFQRYGIELAIEEFSGAKPISSLAVHPLEHHAVENLDEWKETLRKRGEMFRKFCTIPKECRMFKYEWKAILDKEGFKELSSDNFEYDHDDDGMRAILRQRQESVNGEVMVDYKSYYKHGLPTAHMGAKPISEEDLYRIRYDGKKGGSDEIWEDDQIMLCPPRVLGYVLREKQWVQLAVHKIEEIPTKGEGDSAFWDRLRLAGEKGGLETKQLLHALIKNHGITEGKNSYQLDDLVAEKGKGLTILLYGPPGVGKTSTAQTIAAAAHKPLFVIGVADVGTDAGMVESNLEKVFDLATTWRAVLLIDEADVFLQSRARGQMGPTTERNALVSVFLRVLEYYQGILILTTNQISQFDVAVQSRIHIAIRYEGLTKEQTKAIFEGFLEQYKAKGLVQPGTFDDIMRWVDRELSKRKYDGRQIRNVVTSAMGLACGDGAGRCITVEDLRRVDDYMYSFKTDLDYQMRQYEEAQSGVHNPYK